MEEELPSEVAAMSALLISAVPVLPMWAIRKSVIQAELSFGSSTPHGTHLVSGGWPEPTSCSTGLCLGDPTDGNLVT